jgi:hypothetical protein
MPAGNFQGKNEKIGWLSERAFRPKNKQKIDPKKANTAF